MNLDLGWAARSARPLAAATSLLVMVVLVPFGARAETPRPRSETGRHAPKPAFVPEKRPSETSNSPQSGWFAGFGGGVVGGGDLWRLQTSSGAVVPWVSTMPFSSARFRATLGSNFSAGIFAGHRIGQLWSIRAELAKTTMDVAAEALQGQSGGVFLYDQLAVTQSTISLEAHLVQGVSCPFLTAGVVLNHLSASRETALDQNAVGFQLGLGYLQQIHEKMSLRLSARYSRSGFDTGSFQPQTRAGWGQPDTIFEPAHQLGLFGVVLALQFNL